VYFFTPTLTSLRGLHQAAGLDKVQKALGLSRAPGLGTPSAAARDFDPALLRPILARLADRATAAVDGREAEALAGLTAVDGSVFRAPPRMAWALWMGAGHRGAKVHLHFDVIRAAPRRATLTAAACAEVAELGRALEPSRLYVLDRGYASDVLLGSIAAAGSSFLVRLRRDAAFTLAEELPVGEAARQAGVIRDVRAARLGAGHPRPTSAGRSGWSGCGRTRARGRSRSCRCAPTGSGWGRTWWRWGTSGGGGSSCSSAG
jgi:hypothetical protein